MHMETKKANYRKIFKINENNSLYISNPEPLIDEINGWLKDLLHSKIPEEVGDNKVEIINKFLKIYKDDKKNAKLPEPIGEFESENEKKRFIENKILAHDISAYLGELFRTYHKIALSDGWSFPNIDEQFQNKIIKYNELYNKALNEYCLFILEKKLFINEVISMRQLNGALVPFFEPIPSNIPKYTIGEHIYTTTFIMPALIERFLIIQIEKIVIIDDLVDKLFNKINNKEISLLKDELDFINNFKQKGDREYLFNFEKKLYDICIKYQIINEEDNDIKLILLKKAKIKQKDGTYQNTTLTLGTLLKLKYVKKIIKKPYLMLLHYMFDPEYLDIRNNIMHGNNSNFDYFTVNFTAVMVELLLDITTGEIFNLK